MPNFHIAKVGEIDRQWTIITAGERQWEQVEFAATIYESGSKEFLTDLLNSGTIEEAADFIGVVPKRVETLRRRMGIALPLGGDRRSKNFQEHYAEVPENRKSRIAILGKGSRALLLVSARKTDWIRVPKRQIVVEERVAERFADWLKGLGNDDAAIELGVSKSKILSVRKRFDAPSPNDWRAKETSR